MAEIEKAPVRKNFTFKELKIPVGERLYHKDDPKHTCVVLDDKRGIRYEYGDIKDDSRRITHLTNYVYSIIHNTEIRGNFAPLLNWLYEGEILQQRREKLEMAEELIKPPQKIKKHEIVYILSNPSMPDLIKIGHTKDLGQRMYNLSHHTGVPTDFKLEFAGTIKNDMPAETFLHAAFDDKRVNSKKEFFKMSAEYAWNTLKKLIDKQVTLDEENGNENNENK